MYQRQWILTIIVVILINISLISDTKPDQKVIVGWLEKVYFPQYDFALRAKMDIGAKNSSLHAVDLKYIKGKGESQGSRIRFKVVDTVGNYRIIEAPVVGGVSVKKRRTINEDKLTIDLETRPMVELEICLAGITKRIQVNLTNRVYMNYRMLLGRSALAGDFIIDVSQKFLYGSGADCRKK